MIKLLLDENVDLRLHKALIRRAPEMVVLAIGARDAPPLQSSDPEILNWCEKNGFILVTNNRATMTVHLRDHLAAGRHVPGILVLNSTMALQRTVDELVLVSVASTPDDYIDLLLYTPLIR